MAALDSFWSIPPIQDAIGSQLTHVALRRCIVVSTTFHKAFLPFLWRTIQLKVPRYLQIVVPQGNLSQNLCYTETLDLTKFRVSWWPAARSSVATMPSLHSFPYSNLTTFKLVFGFETVSVVSTHLWIWIGTLPSLHTLSILNQKMTPEFLRAFSTTMARLDKLKELDLGFWGPLTSGSLIVLFGSLSCAAEGLDCSANSAENGQGNMIGGLEKLKLDTDRELEWQTSSTRPLTSSNADSHQRTRIRDVWFRIRGQGADRVLASLLKRCPLLERLDLPMRFMAEEEARQDLVRIFQKQVPFLKDFTLYNNVDSDTSENFLESCPSLTRLDLFMGRPSAPVVDVILSRHAESLVDLQMNGASCLEMEELCRIAGSCPSLIRFKARINWVASEADNTDDTASSATAGSLTVQPWICLKLTFLRLYFAGDTRTYQSRLHEGWLSVLYREIGRMKELEELDMTVNVASQEFTAEFVKGVEDHLCGLKKLKEITFSDARERPLTDDQLERMVEYWPELVVFRDLDRQRRVGDERLVVKALRVRLEKKKAEAAVHVGIDHSTFPCV